MSMISFLVQDPTVDKDKLMKICMVHDLAEAIVGDITPHDGVSKEEKRKLEEVCDLNVVLNYKYVKCCRFLIVWVYFSPYFNEYIKFATV